MKKILMSCCTLFIMFMMGCSDSNLPMGFDESEATDEVEVARGKVWKEYGQSIPGKVVAMTQMRCHGYSAVYTVNDRNEVWLLNFDIEIYKPQIKKVGNLPIWGQIKEIRHINNNKIAIIDAQDHIHVYTSALEHLMTYNFDKFRDISSNFSMEPPYPFTHSLYATSKDGHKIYSFSEQDLYQIRKTWNLTNGTRGYFFDKAKVTVSDGKPCLGYSTGLIRHINSTEPFSSIRERDQFYVTNEKYGKYTFDLDTDDNAFGGSRTFVMAINSQYQNLSDMKSKIFISSEASGSKTIFSRTSPDDIMVKTVFYGSQDYIWRLDTDGRIYRYE